MNKEVHDAFVLWATTAECINGPYDWNIAYEGFKAGLASVAPEPAAAPDPLQGDAPFPAYNELREAIRIALRNDLCDASAYRVMQIIMNLIGMSLRDAQVRAKIIAREAALAAAPVGEKK